MGGPAPVAAHLASAQAALLQWAPAAGRRAVDVAAACIPATVRDGEPAVAALAALARRLAARQTAVCEVRTRTRSANGSQLWCCSVELMGLVVVVVVVGRAGGVRSECRGEGGGGGGLEPFSVVCVFVSLWPIVGACASTTSLRSLPARAFFFPHSPPVHCTLLLIVFVRCLLTDPASASP